MLLHVLAYLLVGRLAGADRISGGEVEEGGIGSRL